MLDGYLNEARQAANFMLEFSWSSGPEANPPLGWAPANGPPAAGVSFCACTLGILSHLATRGTPIHRWARLSVPKRAHVRKITSNFAQVLFSADLMLFAAFRRGGTVGAR
jgi:hypothetical protein